jgi:uncharacterized protein (TIGR00375 family)
MQIDCDFHIHSRYSGATSNNMNFETISTQAALKGLDVVGTGDALHPKWLAEMRHLNLFSDGVYELNDCKFVVTLEVEDSRRVHHFILLPDITAAEELRESLSRYAPNLDTDGRPNVKLTGSELIGFVDDVGGIMGPSHAFVPWTSVYKEYGSLKDCYGSGIAKVKFLELGLSGDTYMADLIAELADITFLSNSDAHSPWPHRLGREFNRLDVHAITFREIRNAIERKHGNEIILNVGLDPRLGKYHRTACIRCHCTYDFGEAQSLKWICKECRGPLKKGVRDRISELSSYNTPRHPPHRPKYLRIAPLAEILALAFKKQIYSTKVQEAWSLLVESSGSEIAVLVDAPREEIERVINGDVADMVLSFRDGNFDIIEGGGGKYGEIVFKKRKSLGESQTKLDVFT